MKKLLLQVCVITVTVAPICADYGRNLGQAAANVTASTVDLAAAAVGEPVPARTNVDSTHRHRGLRERYREHRLARDRQRLTEDKAALVRNK